jgi:hypothetical protein
MNRQSRRVGANVGPREPHIFECAQPQLAPLFGGYILAATFATVSGSSGSHVTGGGRHSPSASQNHSSACRHSGSSRPQTRHGSPHGWPIHAGEAVIITDEGCRPKGADGAGSAQAARTKGTSPKAHRSAWNRVQRVTSLNLGSWDCKRDAAVRIRNHSPLERLRRGSRSEAGCLKALRAPRRRRAGRPDAPSMRRSGATTAARPEGDVTPRRSALHDAQSPARRRQ